MIKCHLYLKKYLLSTERCFIFLTTTILFKGSKVSISIGYFTSVFIKALKLPVLLLMYHQIPIKPPPILPYLDT